MVEPKRSATVGATDPKRLTAIPSDRSRQRSEFALNFEKLLVTLSPSFLPSINQRGVRTENDRSFSAQRNLLEGGTINRIGKKNSNTAKEAVSTAT
jgi:hypothetical protein